VEIDTVEAELVKRDLEEPRGCGRTDASAAGLRVPDPDLQLGAPMYRLNRMELARPDEAPFFANAEDPKVVAPLDTVEPGVVLGLRDVAIGRAQPDERTVVDPLEEHCSVFGPKWRELDRRHRLSRSSL
jgi:hypothetical protein